MDLTTAALYARLSHDSWRRRNPFGLRLTEKVMVTAFHAEHFARKVTKRCSSHRTEEPAISLAYARFEHLRHRPEICHLHAFDEVDDSMLDDQRDGEPGGS